jgi:hypothetical protein
MEQQIGGILIDPDRTGLLKFLKAVAAAQEAYAQRPASGRGQHIPDTVADNHRPLDRRTEPCCRGKKQVRIGLGLFDLIAGHDGRLVRIDAERRQIDGGRFHPAARRDRPRNTRL